MKVSSIIFFSNTFWFLVNFKSELLIKLSLKYDITCYYFAEGPPISADKLSLLTKNNIKSIKLNPKLILSLIINNFRSGRTIKDNDSYIVLVTIIPILLSYFFPYRYKRSTIYILEGLGRIFSSRLLKYRIFKHFLLFLYKKLFSNCKKVITLNSSDACYLSELNILKFSDIAIIPGTGLNTKSIDDQCSSLVIEPKFIDFIGRLIPDKGFHKFIYAHINLMNYFPDKLDKFKSRLIAPQKDIDSLSISEKTYLKDLGILIRPYISNPYIYYSESKAIIIPTTYSEGLLRVSLEASYLSIPTLVSRNRGAEEIYPKNYKYFIESFNPYVIASQINSLLEDEQYFKSISKDQINKIKNYYSTEASIKTFMKIIS